MTQPDPTTAPSPISIHAPGLWAIHEKRGQLVVVRLDEPESPLDPLGPLELLLLEARLRYGLDRVRDQLKAGDDDA